MQFNLKKMLFLGSTMLMIMGSTLPACAFDPVGFDQQEQALYVGQNPFDVKENNIKKKLTEVKNKVLAGKISVSTDENDQKILVFLRSVADDADWTTKYPKMAQLVTEFLLRSYVHDNPVAARVVSELNSILKETKDNVFSLVDHDPKFSGELKSAFLEKLAKVNLQIYGITEKLAESVPNLSLADVKIESGHLTGLAEFEAKDLADAKSSAVKFELYRPESLLSSTSQMKGEQNILYSTYGEVLSCLFNGGSYEEQVTKIAVIFGHELAHLVGDYFPETYMISLGASVVDLATYNLLMEQECQKQGLKLADLSREDLWRVQYQCFGNGVNIFGTEYNLSQLKLATPDDRAYFQKIYCFISDNFEKYNQDLAKSKGVDLAKLAGGSRSFSEILPDCIGVKAALKFARNRKIASSDELVWQSYGKFSWDTQDLSALEKGCGFPVHSTSPFRTNGCFNIVTNSNLDLIM